MSADGTEQQSLSAPTQDMGAQVRAGCEPGQRIADRKARAGSHHLLTRMPHCVPACTQMDCDAPPLVGASQPRASPAGVSAEDCTALGNPAAAAQEDQQDGSTSG